LNENQPKTAQQCPRKTSQSAEVQQVPRSAVSRCPQEKAIVCIPQESTKTR